MFLKITTKEHNSYKLDNLLNVDSFPFIKNYKIKLQIFKLETGEIRTAMGYCGATDTEEEENEAGHHKLNITCYSSSLEITCRLAAEISLKTQSFLPIKMPHKVSRNVLLVKIQIKKKNKKV